MAYDQKLADVEREAKGMEQEIADLRGAGDLMQSSLSRVSEWVRTLTEYEAQLPYEVKMALLEGDSAVELWTEVRRGA